MPNRANNFINLSLREKIKQINDKLHVDGLNIEESLYGRIAQFYELMVKLYKSEKSSFDDDGELKEDKAREYYQLCADIKEKYSDMASLISNEKINKSKEMTDLYNEIAEWKSQLYPEIEEYTREYVPDTKWELNEDQKRRRNELMNEWNAYFETHDAPELPFYNEDEYANDLRAELKLLGNMNDLASYYAKNEAQLSNIQKNRLKSLGQSIAFYKKLGDDSKKYKHEPVFNVVEKNENGVSSVELSGYKGQYQHQNSANGCWSCALSMMLKSRGISLDQRIIRAYRPPFKYSQALQRVRTVQGSSIIRDSSFNINDQADLVNRLIPNTALVTTNFSQLKALNGNQKNVVTNQIKRMVSDTLKNTKTPVAMSVDGHFVTIVGIEGDNLKILDSMEPNIETTRSIASLMDTEGVSFTRFHDLMVTKDRQMNNIPQNVSYVKTIGLGLEGGVMTDGKLYDVNVSYPIGGPPMVNAAETWYLPNEVVDPDTLQAPDENVTQFFRKKFEMNLPELPQIDEVLRNEKQSLAYSIAGFKNHPNDHSPAEFEGLLKDSVARIVAYESLKNDFGKPGMQDKFMLQRALGNIGQFVSNVKEAPGFNDYFEYLTKEDGVLNEGIEDYTDTNIGEYIYEEYKSKVEPPVFAFRKVLAQTIPEETKFDTKIYADELKEIKAQIGKALKNTPKKGAENVRKHLTSLTDAVGKLSDRFDNYNGAKIEGQGREFNAMFYSLSKPGYDIKIALNDAQIPSKSQIQAMKLFRRLENAKLFAAQKMDPMKIAKFKLCEKLLAEQATNLMKSQKQEDRAKGMNMLKSDYNHAVAFNQIYISRTFDNLVRNKDLKAMNKLIKSDNKKMLTAFQAKFRTEFPEQQVQMQGNPQVQAQANQSATPQNTTPTTPQNNTSTTPAGPGMGGL